MVNTGAEDQHESVSPCVSGGSANRYTRATVKDCVGMRGIPYYKRSYTYLDRGLGRYICKSKLSRQSRGDFWGIFGAVPEDPSYPERGRDVTCIFY